MKKIKIVDFITVDGVSIMVKKIGKKIFICVSGSKEYVGEIK
jgi:hypothetical protein